MPLFSSISEEKGGETNFPHPQHFLSWDVYVIIIQEKPCFSMK